MAASSNLPENLMKPYDPKIMSIELWLSLLEVHFTHFKINDDIDKRNILLLCVGTRTYKSLGFLCAPKLPNTFSYNDLIIKLKNYYVLKQEYHYSLMDLQTRKKKSNESLMDLYKDLRKLAWKCDFGEENFDLRVRDQLLIAVEEEDYFPELMNNIKNMKNFKSQWLFEKISNFEMKMVIKDIINLF